MEYFATLKRNEILTHTTTWMNPDNIMLSEISQIQKGQCFMIPLYEAPRVIKLIETGSRRVAVRSCRR
jgi:hypothetical protein